MTNKRSSKKMPTVQGIGHSVQDAAFRGHPFFNPVDAMQVKYEMLRRVDVEGLPVAATVKAFGFSRVSFYAIRKRFRQEGLVGLLERPRGPKGGHKLKGAALELVREMSRVEADPAAIAAALREKTGMLIHPRTVRRAMAAPKKKAGRPLREPHSND